jgi:hypothetical protein
VKTPNFKRLKKRNQLPINPYAKHVEILSDPVSTWTAQIDGYPVTPTSAMNTYYYRGNCIYGGTSTSALVSADDPTGRTTAKLLQELGEAKAQTLVTAAESRKTADHLAKTATRIYRAIKALKKGEFRAFTEALGTTASYYEVRRLKKRFDRAKSFDKQENHYSERLGRRKGSRNRKTDFAADTWLEFSYAWKPLLKDVYDHAEALAALAIERSNEIREVKARVKTQAFASTRDFNYGSIDLLEKETRDRRWCKMAVRYRIPNGGLSAFHQLGINNPLSVPWELLPFSFVVDWFIPIGQFIESLAATSGLTFVDGWKTIRNVSETKLKVTGNGKSVVSGAARYGPLVGSRGAERFVMDIVRTKLTAFPPAQFPGFRDPRKSDSKGYPQAASAIALLQSIFLRGK